MRRRRAESTRVISSDGFLLERGFAFGDGCASWEVISAVEKSGRPAR